MQQGLQAMRPVGCKGLCLLCWAVACHWPWKQASSALACCASPFGSTTATAWQWGRPPLAPWATAKQQRLTFLQSATRGTLLKLLLQLPGPLPFTISTVTMLQGCSTFAQPHECLVEHVLPLPLPLPHTHTRTQHTRCDAPCRAFTHSGSGVRHSVRLLP